MCLIKCSIEFDLADNYLINCGSPSDVSVGDRVFLDLYKTARIYPGNSNYTFSITKHGRHWIRLHFFPFVYQNYNLSHAIFSVSAQHVTLLKDFQLQDSSPVMKEYSLNITSDKLVLTIAPSAKSFAFLNALQVVSVPDELISNNVETIDPPGSSQNLLEQALETVYRVNMGNASVNPQNDTLSREWIPDEPFLKHRNLVKFVSKPQPVNYTKGGPTLDIAPPDVYGTVSKLDSAVDPNLNANVTWNFNIDPGFRTPGQMVFNVYINTWYAYKHMDLSKQTSNLLASPYYLDAVLRETHSNMLSVSVGPVNNTSFYPNALLNELEIMKINNSRVSLDKSDANIHSSNTKTKTALMIGITVGASVIVLLLASVLSLVFRRRRRSYVDTYGGKFTVNGEFGYRFSLAAVREATDNFSDSLVVGVGGFGKVYKGVLKDNRKVAIKRGNSDSQQGMNEFRTEIEMLSHFRHRHLVALIGYCDEQNEMILLYEYMENGTLKSHLYGPTNPCLSWKQRLKICIGSARGLHYLHTGSAKPIIHRDVKSANILLDENLMAKVADFGLSKAGPNIDKTHVTTAVKGSFGYLDPEYLIRQQLTEKSDAYSFGVVLFEVLCGRPVIDPSLPREMVNLVEWAMKLEKKGELEKIIDPKLESQIKPESLGKYIETAEKCLAECGIDRPTMGEVLCNLEYALQLQEDDVSSNNGDISLRVADTKPLQAMASTRPYSLESAQDLLDASMSKVFSNMKNGEVR
ncbi:hypothetical protein Cgig2_020934 [Carnegiea gigantea]|uniref:Protein kinase domain-containing protein n=1 Tax=Carnegiea gigantea TaxID=171969 RepID=A0A9Q1JIN3_9CARY|nr:hypothetical protein Cgig2_020934 [Carnegiea gigantea]